MENGKQLVVILQAHKSQLSPSAVKKIKDDFATHGVGLVPIIFGGDVVEVPKLHFQEGPAVVMPTTPQDEEN